MSFLSIVSSANSLKFLSLPLREIACILAITFILVRHNTFISNRFVDLSIVKEVTGKKRGRRYTYWEYLDCLAEGTAL